MGQARLPCSGVDDKSTAHGYKSERKIKTVLGRCFLSHIQSHFQRSHGKEIEGKTEGTHHVFVYHSQDLYIKQRHFGK